MLETEEEPPIKIFKVKPSRKIVIKIPPLEKMIKRLRGRRKVIGK